MRVRQGYQLPADKEQLLRKAILLFGLFMLISSLSSLLRQEHPSIGHFQLFDWQYPIWAGWVMIAALLYSIIPPVILGRMKLPLARALHESTLYADAQQLIKQSTALDWRLYDLIVMPVEKIQR